jgi:hypothetical protein
VYQALRLKRGAFFMAGLYERGLDAGSSSILARLSHDEQAKGTPLDKNSFALIQYFK